MKILGINHQSFFYFNLGGIIQRPETSLIRYLNMQISCSISLNHFYLSTNSITINYSRIKLHIGILIHSYRYISYYPLVFYYIFIS